MTVLIHILIFREDFL